MGVVLTGDHHMPLPSTPRTVRDGGGVDRKTPHDVDPCEARFAIGKGNGKLATAVEMGIAFEAIKVAQEATHRHPQAFAFDALAIGGGREGREAPARVPQSASQGAGGAAQDFGGDVCIPFAGEEGAVNGDPNGGGDHGGCPCVDVWELMFVCALPTTQTVGFVIGKAGTLGGGLGRHHIGDGGKGAPLDVDADDLATVGQRVAFVGVQATHPGGGQGKEYAVSTYFSMVARRCL